MKRLSHLLLTLSAWALAGLAFPVVAGVAQFDQTALLYSDTNAYQRGVNYRSVRGVPLSNTAGTPAGSDGRAPIAAGTSKQFSGFVAYGAIVRPGGTNLNASSNYAQNAGAANLDLPRLTNDTGTVLLVLRSAQVGAPYLSRQVSYLFGSIIAPPVTDENGAALTNNVAYWAAEPHTTDGHANASYYWSPHAQAVFAIQSGPVEVTWRKAQPGANVGLVATIGGIYYGLTNANYVVAGSAVKPARKIYWTEGTFRDTGKPVAVPAARVGGVRVGYSSTFPERVATAYVAAGESLIATNGLQEVRTLWYDHQQGQIFAYNREGRIFLELLGDAVGGETRQHLGYEIVDVFQQPVPTDVTTELGEKITAYADARADAHLDPAPLLVGAAQPFLYQHSINGSTRMEHYAARETANQNDVMVHWLEESLAGLRWPSIYARYQFVWPGDVAKYSHYVRPLVATEQEAALTAVLLPTDNVPTIQYQDPLDYPRGKLTAEFKFYSFLDASQPAHRTLLRFTSGDRVAFERVFSWLEVNLKTPALFTGSVATNLATWNPTNNTFNWTNSVASAPRVVSQPVEVGSRIAAPGGELGAAGSYLAGYILQTNGNSFNPVAYRDPFVSGFEAANRGAIIPVNAIPGRNTLDIWWFRKNETNAVKNQVNGFKPIYWPTVIGRYTLAWPAAPAEIVLASNDGSGALESLQANGTIYTQNDLLLPGYNPNEEHALMLGGQAYALRDDLNVTTGAGYSSQPFVLLDYTAADGRPSMRAFKVLREKPTAGVVFDYIVTAGGNRSRSGAGSSLQAPMPLPFLPPPVEYLTNGATITTVNYNTEPGANSGDLPVGWTAAHAATYPNYARFTYKDRKDNFWVLRGLHAGLPTLESGTYNTGTLAFTTNLPAATAVVGQPFTNIFHTSRQTDALVLTLVSGAVPSGLGINGLTLAGSPTAAGSNFLTFAVTDTSDGVTVTNTLSINVVASGTVVAQGPLTLISTNQYALNNATYVGRPPFLAAPAAATNAFTMRFYYKTQAGFAWPGVANPPAVGGIVPYLRPLNGSGQPLGNATLKTTPALDIVYRPVWPSDPPTMKFGQTLTDPKDGLPAVRGQTSVQVLYQQSIGQNITAVPPAVVLHDPTREKSFALPTSSGLTKLPDGVRTESYQGKTYFPNLPPHLAQRFFFDPNRGAKGSLVFKGEFKNELFGEKYLLLNVLVSDLATVSGLCPGTDPAKANWDAAVAGLTTKVETFYENPAVPGDFIVNPTRDVSVGVGALAEVSDSNTAVDSYALSAAGPGQGYVTLIVGNGGKFTPAGEPVTVYVLRVAGQLHTGELKIIPSANPLSELSSFQHTADMAGKFHDYEYEWKIAPPVDGAPPAIDATMSRYQPLTNGLSVPRYTLGGAGIQALVDNYIVLRYRPKNTSHPLYNQWSEWTRPQLAEGWIKRVLAGINPFNQRVTDLYSNTVNTDANILTSAGKRWEGDIALNLENINNYGLIEIYETILRRGKGLSIESGINFGPANDALLLAAGYLNDLYMLVGNEAYADASNPTIGIGTKDNTYGDIATALFAFKGQTPSLLEEELALLRGRDDVLQPGVGIAPVYNRLVWNYTRGIDAGEVIYALNYNILDQNTDGKVDAADAAKLFPQGHGDAYGHYLTATKGYYSLLLNTKFDWVPRTEAVTVLGQPVQVDYLDERKFATAAAAVARTGRQIFDLTWRKDYVPGKDLGWERFATNRVSTRTMVSGVATSSIVREWGADQWASRTGQGAFLNWIVGNAILPDVDPNPAHEGIQKIDRTTVPELQELSATAADLQTALDNAEGRLTPLGLAEGSLAFDINPNQVVGSNPQTHFEQIYSRAKGALNNAVASFDDAKDVTRLMRSEQDSLSDFATTVARQELAYTNALIELYGTPYPDDVGPGKTYKQGYAGPDFIHHMYVDNVQLTFPGNLDPQTNQVFKIDLQTTKINWLSGQKDALNTVLLAEDETHNTNGVTYLEYNLDSHGFTKKPTSWTGKRPSPGRLQQAISEVIQARGRVASAMGDAQAAKDSLDDAIRKYKADETTKEKVADWEERKYIAEKVVKSVEVANEIFELVQDSIKEDIVTSQNVVKEALPQSLVAGLAAGGDLTSAGRSAIEAGGLVFVKVIDGLQIARKTALLLLRLGTDQAASEIDLREIDPLKETQETRQALAEFASLIGGVQGHAATINASLQAYDDAQRAYRTALAQGERLQAEREIFRQRAAAVIQGFRTRDAAFRIFRNEKLERYKALFDLSSRYAYLAANAYDYETGLLHTDQGKAFVNRIVSARALGVVKAGEPQYAGSNTGDPGLSSALAEMKADWDVVKGRLGFNNPDAYGTTVSLRTEKLRILPGSDGTQTWQDVLQQGRVDNLLDDTDVRRYCLQIDPGTGLPVPGIVLTFSTTITPGQNLFGQPLAAGDSTFNRSSFATKLFAVGVALEGYRGMNNPVANGSAVNYAGGTSPADPSSSYLDPKALAATPYVYLIPVGVDAMRSPPLGDASVVRTWNVDDVTIPLPFNIGASDFSTKQLYQSADSLTEPLFGIRKHQAFRPVSTTTAFSADIYGLGGSLQPSQFTNRRLIGRTVWNTKWKLVIPGDTLLNDPKEGLDRFIQTVSDVKLHLVTYGYSGN